MSEAVETTHPTSIMETSEGLDAIAKVLPKAQASMGEVFKNANNPAFRSKYADLAAVIDAVVPALNRHGITLLQPAAFDGQAVRVATMLLHESGQWVRCTLSAPLSKRDAQGIGSACTYLRRYGLQSMSGVAPEDDDGNAASAPRKDYSPSSVGPDFEGAEGSFGRSSHAAKKDGGSERFTELRKEIETLESMTAVGVWQKERVEEIKAFPEAWRKQLREDLEEQKRIITSLAETADA
jgi:hypothetical protein